MKKMALILALAFPLVTGVALSSAFALGLLPVLSNDACYIAKVGITHLVAIPASYFHRRMAA